MAITADEPWLPLLHELSAINDIMERNEFEDARERLLALKASCAAKGVRSAHVLWHLAIACDYLGDGEMAYENIREALDLDPISIPFWKSYRIIVERMQTTLTDDSRPADDPLRPRLYNLLVTANEVTLPCHVAIARYHRATGKVDEAVRMLEALTLLHPAYLPAWRELARAAEAAGRQELVDRAETQAILLGADTERPFTPLLARAEA